MDEKDKGKNLRLSYWEGIFGVSMTGFTQDYLVPFLLLLGGTVRHVGILNAVPNLFAALVQLKGADLTDYFKSRKKAVSIFIFLQSMMLLVMSIATFFIEIHPGIFIAMVVLFCSLGALVNPAWGSLLSDLVPEHKRGEYFGWRNRNLGFVTTGVTLMAGLILYTMKAINPYHGFVIIFAFAFLSRMISLFFLNKMREPVAYSKEGNHFTLFDFLSRMKRSNFAKFVIFAAAMSFVVNLASPYFAVLMLRDLKFNYLLYTVINLSATFTIFILMRRWGIHADKVGNLKVIRVTAPLIGFIPLLWILNRHPVYLVLAQIFSGFAWAGFNLCCSNFIYDAVTPAKRTRCIAYFNLLNGLALCSGALLGGFMLKYLPEIFGYKILTLFLISAVLRISIGLLMPVFLKEVRPIDNVSSQQLFFSMVGMKPILGVERKTLRY